MVSAPKSNQTISKALLKHYKTTEPEETEESLALDQSFSSSILNCIILCSCLLHLISGLLVNSETLPHHFSVLLLKK